MIKINDEFYQEDNNYNIDIYGDYERDIVNYINEYQKENYNQIIENDKRTNIITVFSEIRTNIIKWYPFNQHTKVLEIGANYGELTQELVKRCENVTALEFTKIKAECISKRLEDIKNLNIILTTDLKRTKIDDKFDYITLIGISEYAEKLGFENLSQMLKWSYDHLTENGKILCAIDNEFGVKYLAGSTKSKEEVPFANYKQYVKKDYKLYGKTQLEDMLIDNNLKNYKFYYPVPNYNLTHLIYTDKYLPRQGNYDIYYREDEEILFNEQTMLNEAIKNRKFDFLTNSFLIEITKKENDFSNVNLAKFSNMRKEKYKIITKIKEDGVSKEAYEKKSIKHIEQIQNNIENLEKLGFSVLEEKSDDKIISKYTEKYTMNEYFENLLKQDKIEEFYQELYKWYSFIKNKISIIQTNETIFEKYNIEITKEQKNRLTILKDGFLDLIFQNVFYDGDEYIVFDQEWYEEAVPLEFIMYRSIKNLLFTHDELKNKINIKDLYMKYNIENYIEIFEQLEEKWQKEIVDKQILDFYSEKWNRIISLEDIKFKYNQELGEIYSKRDELQLENNKLQLEKNELQQEIEILKNSRFYKWTRFLSRRNKENE